MEKSNSKKYAVIGDPIKHSLSPQMHNAAFADLGIDALYSAEHVKESELADFANRARVEFSGFNVTVPHKENIIQYLDDITEECKVTGSVNTVTNRDGLLYGASTDGYGLEMALKEGLDLSLEGHTFLFLGCGGTVNAVAYHFLKNGANGLYIVNRTGEKAAKLADELKRHFPEANIDFAQSNDNDKIESLLNNSPVSVIIQATSLGLNETDPSPLDAKFMRPEIAMFDTIYKNTNFIKAAKKCGCKVAQGQGMLVNQGAKAFEIWTGKMPSLKVMREALGR